jgi:hypothetical protein
LPTRKKRAARVAEPNATVAMKPQARSVNNATGSGRSSKLPPPKYRLRKLRRRVPGAAEIPAVAGRDAKRIIHLRR